MTPTFSGRIVEWDRDRGCGWIESEGQRIFLHVRDLSERRRWPEVGDEVRFVAGTGPTGKTCARHAELISGSLRQQRDRPEGHFTFLAAVWLCALLIMPALATARLPLAARFTVGYPVAVSLVAYWIYARDKRQARANEWRTSEKTLHLLELIGGWPGAFVAQRRLRHKCSKLSYQLAFWLIVAAHQYMAFDLLTDGPMSGPIRRALREFSR